MNTLGINLPKIVENINKKVSANPSIKDVESAIQWVSVLKMWLEAIRDANKGVSPVEEVDKA